MRRESFEAGAGVTDRHPPAEQTNDLLGGAGTHASNASGLLVGFLAASAESAAQFQLHVGRHVNNLTRKVSSNDAMFVAGLKGLVAGTCNTTLALLRPRPEPDSVRHRPSDAWRGAQGRLLLCGSHVRRRHLTGHMAHRARAIVLGGGSLDGIGCLAAPAGRSPAPAHPRIARALQMNRTGRGKSKGAVLGRRSRRCPLNAARREPRTETRIRGQRRRAHTDSSRELGRSIHRERPDLASRMGTQAFCPR